MKCSIEGCDNRTPEDFLPLCMEHGALVAQSVMQKWLAAYKAHNETLEQLIALRDEAVQSVKDRINLKV